MTKPDYACSDKKRRDYLWGTTGVVYLGSGLDDISQLEAVLEKLPSSPPVPVCLLDASDENISSNKTGRNRQEQNVRYLIFQQFSYWSNFFNSQSESLK